MTSMTPKHGTVEQPLAVNRCVTQETHGSTQMVVDSRLAMGFDGHLEPFPIFRTSRYSVRGRLDTLLENLASSPSWRVTRFTETSMLMRAEGVLVKVRGVSNRKYASLWCQIWATNGDMAASTINMMESRFADALITCDMFSLDWYFVSGKGMLVCTSIEEMSDEPASDLAYPYIHGGVSAFIERYLSSEEAVLVLQGPPGTGKTRLIRQILGAISRRSGRDARVIYTGDSKALASDEIFIDFISGDHDAFVVEDADEILKPRNGGNEDLHRFLAVADGVIHAQGRKLIFSTNLPNLGDLDDALIRPGRCFARVNARRLSLEESLAFVEYLSGCNTTLRSELTRGGFESFSLAELYKLRSVKRA